MGRRFLLILGMMLLALSIAPAVCGQVADPTPTEGVADPPVDGNVAKAQATLTSRRSVRGAAAAPACRRRIACRWANSRSPSPSTSWRPRV